jgi:hypothetical protein
MKQWTPVTEALPELPDDYGFFQRSRDVLALDAQGFQRVCYYEAWTDNEYPPAWRICGPEGHVFEDATHWMPLPETPKL